MTCVTAARASHLVLGLKFSKPAQAGLGVAGTEFPFFPACSGLLVSGGGHLMPGEGCQHSGGCLGWCKQVVLAEKRCGILEGE